ncbi:MAG: hypothetical protein K0R54_4814 [Clostridiaceae bacterium]|jgi:hypothetical protein|nr:hypothetical protein [Clostridiaceae bacterium]
MKVVSKEIEMIAYFKSGGKIAPIKFRIEEDNKWKVIKVDRIISMDLEKLCGNKLLVYTCSAVIEGTERIFEIKYDIEKCKWILYKI